MFMPCPHCGYVVALVPPSSAAGPGATQRCPRCERGLPAETPEPDASLEGDSATGASAGDPLAASNTERADGTSSIPAGDDASLADGLAATAAAPAVDASAPSTSRPAPARRNPSFVRGSTPTRKFRVTWPWYAASVALGLVLALQLLLAQRHELAASARWRPWVEGLCSTLPCEIPPWHEPQAFTMLERSVRPSPAVPGVLAVEANFRNDARWPQPWPTLVLSLSDVEGREVGVRAFAPAEYRQGGDAGELLAPGQSATVRLQVREPAPRIVAFTFDFQ